MSKRDYYDILGVQKSASENDLKSAYRRRAKDLHPDRNADDPNAETRFKELNEAYDILKDPQKREAYDRFGHAAFDASGGFGGFGPAGARGGDFTSAFADVFDDLFGDFMGGGRRGGRARGADLRYNLSISLEDAFRGKQETIKVPSAAACETCNGAGAKPGSEVQTCATCSGAGKVRHQQSLFMVERTCPTCSGRGQIIPDPCVDCGGSGRVRRTRSLKVQIPAGVEDGARIRLAGEGEAGPNNGPAGDLYIFLNIEEHPLFRREGPDLFCRMPVPVTDAALGGDIEAPTIDGGRARVKIPAGSQTGKQFRLRGKGMPTLRSNRTGDMYIEITVETPVGLTRRQRELLEEFRSIAPEGANSPEHSGFFQRLREFWGKGGD